MTYRVPEVDPRGKITSHAAFFSHLALTLTSPVHTPDQLLAMMGLAFAP